MIKKQLVIIGNGLATMQLLKELGQQTDYAVTVLSAENVPHYNRIMLSSLLAQETDLKSITPCDDAWYQERNINVLLNHKEAISIAKTRPLAVIMAIKWLMTN